MKNQEKLGLYLHQAVEKLITQILKATLSHPKQTLFLFKMKKKWEQANRRKKIYGDRGVHVPVFLISSITEACNLSCTGCYARSNGICSSEKTDVQDLAGDQWDRFFREAANMGIFFTILAGGEPLLRRDVLEKAAEINHMIFPVFTNGTLLNEEYIDFFSRHLHLIPILSIEGSRDHTDKRRGSGIFSKVTEVMNRFKTKKILYGVSITVTPENMEAVTSESYLNELYALGCKIVIYVEYVPVEPDTEHLTLNPRRQKKLDRSISIREKSFDKMVFLSFPGDEKFMGGCLAAGRGFLHINPHGNAEPCPFSPFSDHNITRHSLEEILISPFFSKLRKSGLTQSIHTGGCVLFQKEEEVRNLLEEVNGESKT